MKRKLLVLMAVGAVLCWASLAAADTYFAYTLGIGNTGPTGSATNLNTPPPYGSILVDLMTPTKAEITFSSVDLFTVTGGGSGWTATPFTTFSYNDYYSFVGSTNPKNPQAGVAVQVNANSFTYAFVSAGPTTDGSIFASVVPAHMDGFGNFNLGFAVPSFGAQFENPFPLPAKIGYDIDQVVFDVFNSSGSWTNVSDVLIKTSDGYLAAAHIAQEIVGPNVPPPGGLNPGYTGFAGVPLPASVLLLGSGLVALGLLRFRRRQHKS